MTDHTHNPTKHISKVIHGKTFTVVRGKYIPGSYEHYVHETSKLINRSYIVTHKLVQDWPLEKIVERYNLCTNNTGTMSSNVKKWWWLRKQDKQT